MNAGEVAGSIKFKIRISQYLIKNIQLLEMIAKYDIGEKQMLRGFFF